MKHQHQTFILGMIKHGDKVQAYRAAYPKCANDETARKSAERLLLHHPAIAAEIEESTAYIRQRAYTEAYQQHIEQQKTPLLSMMKRREILAQIATCEMKVTRFVKNGDRYIMLFEDPRPRDIMKAMELDAKFEDACNRMRNFSDPKLSQFNIYIDGRPCDQPHLPPDPNLPPGIYMLPRRRKNQIENPGIISEQNQIESPPPGDLGVQPAQEKSQIENSGIKKEQNHLSPAGGGGEVRAGGGTIAQEKSQIENSGIKTPARPSHSDGEQNHLSPAGGGGEVRAGGGTLAQKKSLIENSGIISEQNTTQPNPPLGGDRGADPLAASFYKQDKRARESAPPPHILTPEEVKALDEEYARQHADKPPKPSTYGKMYFKEKGINYDNLE